MATEPLLVREGVLASEPCPEMTPVLVRGRLLVLRVPPLKVMVPALERGWVRERVLEEERRMEPAGELVKAGETVPVPARRPLLVREPVPAREPPERMML